MMGDEYPRFFWIFLLFLSGMEKIGLEMRIQSREVMGCGLGDDFEKNSRGTAKKMTSTLR